MFLHRAFPSRSRSPLFRCKIKSGEREGFHLRFLKMKKNEKIVISGYENQKCIHSTARYTWQTSGHSGIPYGNP